jgi:hypothetical protein
MDSSSDISDQPLTGVTRPIPDVRHSQKQSFAKLSE